MYRNMAFFFFWGGGWCFVFACVFAGLLLLLFLFLLLHFFLSVSQVNSFQLTYYFLTPFTPSINFYHIISLAYQDFLPPINLSAFQLLPSKMFVIYLTPATDNPSRVSREVSLQAPPNFTCCHVKKRYPPSLAPVLMVPYSRQSQSR